MTVILNSTLQNMALLNKNWHIECLYVNMNHDSHAKRFTASVIQARLGSQSKYM